MRGLIYLLLALTLLPYLALAAGFAMLGRVIAAGTLAATLSLLLEIVVALIPWGLLALAAALVALLAIAASERWRWLGSCCLCVGATASIVVILLMTGSGADPGALLFLLPCMLVVAGSAWLAIAERRMLRSARPGAVAP